MGFGSRIVALHGCSVAPLAVHFEGFSTQCSHETREFYAVTGRGPFP